MTRLYTIKEVSLRTGLSTQLIRKWEERYEAVAPARFPNGYRGYAREDIDTLLLLKAKVEQGVPIGMAVRERKLLHETASAETPFKQDDLSSSLDIGDYRDQLLDCLLSLDAVCAQRIFDQLAALHDMDFILLEVIQPVLIGIGERWERGKISEFQEHFSSHFMRDRLLAAKNMCRTAAEGPLLVTACSPYERHELGVLFLVYFALRSGFRVVHLGTAPSQQGIVDGLEHLRPEALVFGTSSAELFREAIPFYRKLDRLITEHRLPTKIIIGGSIFKEDEVLEGTRHVHILTGDAQQAIGKIKKLTVF